MNKLYLVTFIACACFFKFCLPLYARGVLPSAQEALLLKDTSISYNAGRYLYYLEDGGRKLSFTDILKADRAGKLVRSAQEYPNFSNYKANFWFKLTIENTDSAVRDWLLEINYPPLDEVEFYYQNQAGKWEVKLLGDKLPFYEREVPARTYILPLPGTIRQATYFFKVHTSGGIMVPIRFTRSRYFTAQSDRTEILHGMFYGVLSLMILYNLVVFIFFRHRSYFFYALTLVGAQLYFVTAYGHAYQYLWPDNPWLNNKMVPFAISIWSGSGVLFARHFLDTDNYSTYFRRIYNWFTTLNIIFFIVIAVTDEAVNPILVRISVVDVLLCCTILLVSAIICAWKGTYEARYFLVAWSVYLVAASITGLRNAGVLPDLPFVNNLLDIGTILQVTILAIALVDKYRRISHEKKKIQQDALRIEREAKDHLEEKVMERTREIALQKEIIEKKNLDITDSISYAHRIQTAMLPHKKYIDVALPEHFILFKPRDVVSGDFYWFARKDHKIIITAVDCTGHGVPGALMSMVGNDLLNSIVIERDIWQADHILNSLHRGVRKVLHQDENESHDGMDIALCVIDQQAGTLEYAGAKNPLYLVQQDEQGTPVFREIKADRVPIGGQQLGFEEQRCFTRHCFDISRPTIFYISSDGFQDQFGGSENKKFMAKRFRELLFNIHQEPMEVQKNRLENKFHQWKGEYEQVDDVLVIGVKMQCH